MKTDSISALVPTFNSSATIRATLESVRWVDEIIVVDSFSTDATIELVRQYGCKVLQHEYINSAMQKNWALPNCTSDWVLQIDSDEEVTPELRDEILQAVREAGKDVGLISMPRKNLFLGRWMRYGGNYPDLQNRLFRRGAGAWQEREVHAHVHVSGKALKLNHPLIHNDWPTLSKMLARLDRYTRYEADELRKREQKFAWHDLVIRPVAVFIYRYFRLQGFRDGWRGFIFSVFMSIYVFMSRAKLWEMEAEGLERSPR